MPSSRSSRRASLAAHVAQRVAARLAEITEQHATIRRGLTARPDIVAVPLCTDDGLRFVSLEVGDGPGGPALFALQPAAAGGGMVVVDSAAGVVVARGRDGTAALRSFAKTLPRRPPPPLANAAGAG
ncbi:hypothetical protein J5Y09_18205 [Roseomonas sp. PWR1]|uniref:Uncharacterized protein n=1 Tax=Roseomonas nitratireducens TaxID=2820810 RepID=A0ABS4AWU9_9PROT|nr:hypothetical protein [Neoroseomonas nitratireducens]MBP0465865.1 hypothetical protein [Neoroseomonas nitratireducens]